MLSTKHNKCSHSFYHFSTLNWQVVEFFPRKARTYLFYIGIIMVLMSWRRKEPWQPLYWLCWTEIIRFLNGPLYSKTEFLVRYSLLDYPPCLCPRVYSVYLITKSSVWAKKNIFHGYDLCILEISNRENNHSSFIAISMTFLPSLSVSEVLFPQPSCYVLAVVRVCTTLVIRNTI